MAIDDGEFCLWPHFLSVDCRKSCSNFTSIWSRLFSYLYFCSVFAGFLPRNCGAPLAAFLRCLFSRLWTGRSLLPTQFRFYLPVAHPCRYHAFYCRQQNLHLRVFSFAHNLSPLMYLLSYIRGDFVYCPVLMVLFRGFCAAPMIRRGITGTRNRRKCRSVSWQRARCGDCITELPS